MIARFDPTKHRRNRLGQFAQMLNGLGDGDSVRLPGGVSVMKKRDGFRIGGAGGATATSTNARLAARSALNRQAKLPHSGTLGGKKSTTLDAVERDEVLSSPTPADADTLSAIEDEANDTLDAVRSRMSAPSSATGARDYYGSDEEKREQAEEILDRVKAAREKLNYGKKLDKALDLDWPDNKQKQPERWEITPPSPESPGTRGFSNAERARLDKALGFSDKPKPPQSPGTFRRGARVEQTEVLGDWETPKQGTVYTDTRFGGMVDVAWDDGTVGNWPEDELKTTSTPAPPSMPGTVAPGLTPAERQRKNELIGSFMEDGYIASAQKAGVLADQQAELRTLVAKEQAAAGRDGTNLLLTPGNPMGPMVGTWEQYPKAKAARKAGREAHKAVKEMTPERKAEVAASMASMGFPSITHFAKPKPTPMDPKVQAQMVNLGFPTIDHVPKRVRKLFAK
jgi:hypothetical protein